MKSDYHVHSEFSDDSKYEIEKEINDFINEGVNEICFTEHVDYGIKRDFDDPRGFEYFDPYGEGLVPLSNCNYPAYISRLNELSEKYKDAITIKKGLELGVQSHRLKEYNDLLDKYDGIFDFFLLSNHQTNDLETWNQEYQKGKSQKEYNEGYYLELLKVVKTFKRYSVLAHLDLINRYDLNGKYPFEKAKPIIEEILKVVIADGKGIEINTSSIRYKVGDLTPSRDILKLYRELGGRIITIGSDTHKYGQQKGSFEFAREELLKLGFEEHCTFEKLKPIFHKL